MSISTGKITPFLWYNDNAEEAINFYCSIFRNSKIISLKRRGENGPVFAATFELEGQKFQAMNGGPAFQFNEAISLFVDCTGQQEVDELTEKLLAQGGKQSRCGWLKDRFGLSWQIIPKELGRLMSDPDPVKSQRVVQAMMQMTKIDVAALQKAYDQE